MGLLDDTVSRLRDVLARVEHIDLWPPWDAAQTIVDAVAQAVAIATEPPGPAPADLTDAAAAWRRAAVSVEAGCDDLATTRAAVGPRCGTARRETRSAPRSSPPHADGDRPARGPRVAAALERLASDMTAARDRHDRADDLLRAHLELSWGDLWPWSSSTSCVASSRAWSRPSPRRSAATRTPQTPSRSRRPRSVGAMDEVDLPRPPALRRQPRVGGQRLGRRRRPLSGAPARGLRRRVRRPHAGGAAGRRRRPRRRPQRHRACLDHRRGGLRAHRRGAGQLRRPAAHARAPPARRPRPTHRRQLLAARPDHVRFLEPGDVADAQRPGVRPLDGDRL